MAPPASPTQAAAPTAEEGDPPEPAINLKSEWVKYVGTSIYDSSGVCIDRAYYRHRLSEQLTLNAPPESVREIRQEKDPERFEMDWRRAGGVMPQKEGWASWIKRGVTETTAVFVEPVALTSAASPAPAPAPASQQESWGTWLKQGAAKAVGVAQSEELQLSQVQTSADTSMTREDLTARTSSIDDMMVSPSAGAATGTEDSVQGSTARLSDIV